MAERPDPAEGVLRAAAIVVLALHGLGAAFPEHLWGVHHLAFLPLPWGLALAGLVAIAMALPRVAPGAAARADRALSRRRVPLAAALVLVGLVVGLPVDHRFLGDTALVEGQLLSGDALQRDDSPVLRAYGGLAQAIGAREAEDVSHLLRLVTGLLGAVFVALALGLAAALHREPTGDAGPVLPSLVPFLVVVAVAPLLQFAGYPEHYAPALVGQLGVALCLLRWHGADTRWLAGAWVTGGLTALAHPLAAPSLAAVTLATILHARRRWQWSPRRTASVAAVAASAGLAGAVAIGRTRAYLLLPLSENAPYGLLSAAHLTDLTNVLFLVAPVQLAILVLGAPRLASAVRSDAAVACLGLQATAQLGAVACIDPALGALDWDLLSLGFLPLAVLAAVVVTRHRPAGRSTLPLVAVLALHLLPWLLVNASGERAVDMVEAMVARDSHHDAERRTKLAFRMQREGFPGPAVRQYGAALQQDDTHPTALRNLGFLLYERGMTDAALPFLGRLAGLHPADDISRTARSALRWHAGQQSAAVRLAVEHLRDHPADARARGLCRRYAAEADSPADRSLAAAALNRAGAR